MTQVNNVTELCRSYYFRPYCVSSIISSRNCKAQIFKMEYMAGLVSSLFEDM